MVEEQTLLNYIVFIFLSFKENSMTRHFMEGSKVVAEAIFLCKPDVVSAYPITPQSVYSF